MQIQILKAGVFKYLQDSVRGSSFILKKVWNGQNPGSYPPLEVVVVLKLSRVCI